MTRKRPDDGPADPDQVAMDLEALRDRFAYLARARAAKDLADEEVRLARQRRSHTALYRAKEAGWNLAAAQRGVETAGKRQEGGTNGQS